MRALLFGLSAIVLLATAGSVIRLARVRSLPAIGLIVLVTPMAELVFIAQVLDLIGLLGSIPAYLITEGVLWGLVFTAARKWGRKTPRKLLTRDASEAIKELWSEPLLALWMAATIVVYLFNLLITFVVPPNNNDALSTHIARVGFWLRHGSLAAWETDRWYQLIYPPNAQLILYWQALFLRSDILFGALQWISAVGAGFAVYALSRQLAFGRKASASAALSMLAFPVVLFQSTTSQNDLVMSFAVISAVVFAIRAAQGRSIADIAFFMLAAAFGLGIKQTFFFFSPALLLFGGWAIVVNRKALSARGWAGFAVIILLLFTIFGGNKYIENFSAYGNPFGPTQVLENQTNQQSADQLPEKLAVNSLRALYGAIDPAGLPDPWFGYFHKIRAAVFSALPIRAAIESPNFLAEEKVFLVDTVYPANEDTAQYGPAYLLLLLGSVGVALKRAATGDPPALFILISAIASFVLLILMRPGWDEFQARYMIPSVGLLLPYWGWVLSNARLPWRTMFVALGVLSLYSVSMFNPAKPVLGKDAANMNIWTADRVTLMMAQNRSLAGSVRMVEARVPADAPLGVFAASEYNFQYPFFGQGFTRDVIPIVDEARLNDAVWLAENHLDHLLLRVLDGDNFTRPPANYYKVDASEGWRLYERKP